MVMTDMIDREESLQKLEASGGLGESNRNRNRKITGGRPRSEPDQAEPSVNPGCDRWERRGRWPVRLRMTLKNGPP